MLFGNSSRPWDSLTDEIRLIAGFGMGMVEVVIEPPAAAAEILMINAPAIKAALKKHKLVAYGHAPHFISLGSPEIVERASSVLMIQHAIDASAAIGIEKLVVHASGSGYAMFSPKEREKMNRMMADSFGFLRDYAKKNNVEILAENTGESSEEFIDFLKRVDGLNMAFDAGHAFMRGGMKCVKKYLENVHMIGHMHIHDNDGSGDLHIALGKGRLNVSEFMSLLRKSGYSKSITFEIFAGDRENGVRKSMEMIKKGLGI